jgi:seryl-tRNA synthetase
MLDPKLVRAETERVRAQLARRGYAFDLGRFQDLEGRRKSLQVETEKLQAERNARSREIGQAKGRGEDVARLMRETEALKGRLDGNSASLAALQDELDRFLLDLPNLPQAGVPEGRDAAANVELRRWGTPRPGQGVRDHADLGEALGQMDFAAAAKVTGARFVVLRGALARLHRALAQFMLDLHTREHGYEELYVPYLVSGQSMRGTGQLPKFGADLFKIAPIEDEGVPAGEAEKRDLYLIPTAEVPVTNLHRDEILDSEQLPIAYCAYSACFRSEAGSYGKDTRGMIRLHQFDKIELVRFERPEDAEAALEQMTAHAEEVLKRLQLHYRVMDLCVADLGASPHRTYDIEVWLPGQNAYREVSSCSWFGDYQARRAKIRYRPEKAGKPRLLHTLNGSGLPLGRTMVAVLEQYQQADGSVKVPDVLIPYMGGVEVLR